jgi:hypothetical protein
VDSGQETFSNVLRRSREANQEGNIPNYARWCNDSFGRPHRAVKPTPRTKATGVNECGTSDTDGGDMNAHDAAYQFLKTKIMRGEEPPQEAIKSLVGMLDEFSLDGYRKALQFAKKTFEEEQDRFFDLLIDEMLRVDVPMDED